MRINDYVKQKISSNQEDEIIEKLASFSKDLGKGGEADYIARAFTSAFLTAVCASLKGRASSSEASAYLSGALVRHGSGADDGSRPFWWALLAVLRTSTTRWMRQTGSVGLGAGCDPWTTEYMTDHACLQLAESGLLGDDLVPRIPRKINQRQPSP